MPEGDRPDVNATQDLLLEVIDDVTGLRNLRSLPLLLVSVVVGLPVFALAAALLGIPYFGITQLLHPTGSPGAILGIAWFGGSLLLTAWAVRRLLRGLNAVLRRRNLPTLY